MNNTDSRLSPDARAAQAAAARRTAAYKTMTFTLEGVKSPDRSRNGRRSPRSVPHKNHR